MNRILCVFAKPPRPGTAKTRLAADLGDHPAARMAEAMLMDVIAHCEASQRATRLVMAYTHEPEWFRMRLDERWEYHHQEGANLGERMVNAANALGDADETVVIVGMDSPQVPTRIMDSAFEALKSHDAVFGPCEDGGYYLLGARPPWPSNALEGVSWSTESALDDSIAALQSHGIEAELLPSAYDVDEIADLRRLVGQMKADPNHDLPHLHKALATGEFSL